MSVASKCYLTNVKPGDTPRGRPGIPDRFARFVACLEPRWPGNKHPAINPPFAYCYNSKNVSSNFQKVYIYTYIYIIIYVYIYSRASHTKRRQIARTTVPPFLPEPQSFSGEPRSRHSGNMKRGPHEGNIRNIHNINKTQHNMFSQFDSKALLFCQSLSLSLFSGPSYVPR